MRITDLLYSKCEKGVSAEEMDILENIVFTHEREETQLRESL